MRRLAILRFNPRAHAGRDIMQYTGLHDRRGFNPRAHAGRDIFCHACFALSFGFNPRAHAGRDKSLGII